MKPSTIYHLAGRIHELAFVLERGEETLDTVDSALAQFVEDHERTESEDCTRHCVLLLGRGIQLLGEELWALQRQLTQIGDAAIELQDGIVVETPGGEVVLKS